MYNDTIILKLNLKGGPLMVYGISGPNLSLIRTRLWETGKWATSPAVFKNVFRHFVKACAIIFYCLFYMIFKTYWTFQMQIKLVWKKKNVERQNLEELYSRLFWWKNHAFLRLTRAEENVKYKKNIFTAEFSYQNGLLTFKNFD